MEGIKFKIISEKQITATYEKNSLNFGEIIDYFNQIIKKYINAKR